MNIIDLKKELVKGVVLKGMIAREEAVKFAVEELPISTVVDICATWPEHYKEHCEALSGTKLIDSGLRNLACDIVLREASAECL